ncbi:major facilitator superfamily domain-containing protein [Mycena albidolilacea]|uniref:Major facilitator superfamily domain-containing protein n=1 Tax=Mycena albidolilacea TaxID=1033008 RepID=A0AAD6ZDS2_9AGAR|nr:major facilitator superfamily domain-containing protein [Mycena albidolilacea]
MSTVLSTVVDYVAHGESGVKRPSRSLLHLNSAPTLSGSGRSTQPAQTAANGAQEEFELQSAATDPPAPVDDPELRLPNRGSLAIMIATNALLEFAFFVTISSAAMYAEYLGGSALFSGLTIGIPAVTSGLALIPLTRYDGGQYSLPLKVAYISVFLGSILYAVAYRAHFLYLILIGRIVSGFGFSGFMYAKRYCSDPRIIGIRRRTTLASWLVLGQGFGFSVGPFVGGLLYKVGFSNQVFNGYTSSGWVTSFITVFFTIASLYLFEDLPKPHRVFSSNSVELGAASALASAPPVPAEVPVEQYGIWQLSGQQWGVIISMCWSSMSCFFVLSSWDSNIPIFTAAAFNYTPYAAGNFIALGGIATLPFLLASVRYSPRFQDRTVLATGSVIGLTGLVLALVLLATDRVVFGSFYVCWVLVALGFNLASTCTLSLLSKQLPNAWNSRTSVAIQYSNYCGRVTGSILGGAGVQMGMKNYIAVQIGVVGVGALLHLTFWKQLKAKTG